MWRTGSRANPSLPRICEVERRRHYSGRSRTTLVLVRLLGEHCPVVSESHDLAGDGQKLT